MILVTGATGKVGSAAVRALRERRIAVRALARDPRRAGELAAAGAEVVEGDLEKSATLDAALAGIRSVILVSPAVPAQELNVVDSAVRAGVGSGAIRRRACSITPRTTNGSHGSIRSGTDQK